MDIWAACRERVSTVTIESELIRIVESQEQVATGGLVGNLVEQSLLEGMLERSKPPLPAGTDGLHYLLSTPFRYPPLPAGSRFGTRFEPGLFYASRTTATALAEAAYYRFVFWSGMERPPPSSRLMTQHTVFAAYCSTVNGLQLQHAPFAEYEEYLVDPGDYASTQQLGSAMRGAGISAFEYVSARDPHKGINVALFTPEAFRDKEPSYQESWLCETRADTVVFAGLNDIHQFNLGSYLINGRLPHPAL